MVFDQFGNTRKHIRQVVNGSASRWLSVAFVQSYRMAHLLLYFHSVCDSLRVFFAHLGLLLLYLVYLFDPIFDLVIFPFQRILRELMNSMKDFAVWVELAGHSRCVHIRSDMLVVVFSWIDFGLGKNAWALGLDSGIEDWGVLLLHTVLVWAICAPTEPSSELLYQ